MQHDEAGHSSIPVHVREPTTAPVAARDQHVMLAGGQRLVVERHEDRDLLRLVGRDGRLSLTLVVTPEGPVLRFEGNLQIEASGDLELGATRIAVHAREALSLSSGGTTEVTAAGDLDLRARAQNITAERGNVNLKANDDVRIVGERVRVNC